MNFGSLKDSLVNFANKAVEEGVTQVNRITQITKEVVGSAEVTSYTPDYIEASKRVESFYQFYTSLMRDINVWISPDIGEKGKQIITQTVQFVSQGSVTETVESSHLKQIGINMSAVGGSMLSDEYGKLLSETGQTLEHIANLEISMRHQIRNEVLSQLHHVVTQELSHINNQKNQLNSARIDLDASKSKMKSFAGTNNPALSTEVSQREIAFRNTMNYLTQVMQAFLSNSDIHVKILRNLISELHSYHIQCSVHLADLKSKLESSSKMAAGSGKHSPNPKSGMDAQTESSDTTDAQLFPGY